MRDPASMATLAVNLDFHELEKGRIAPEDASFTSLGCNQCSVEELCDRIRHADKPPTQEPAHNPSTPKPMQDEAKGSKAVTFRRCLGQVWQEGKLYTVIPDRLYFACHGDEEQTRSEIASKRDFFFFSSDIQEQYQAFCWDFGPVDLGLVVRFCQLLRDRINHPKLQRRSLVYYCDADPKHIANTCFLLAAYLVIEHKHTPEDAAARFTGFYPCPFDHFRDATYSRTDFDLSIKDCCSGIAKAMETGWFDIENFDLQDFEELYYPDTDMSQICPELWAFRGPTVGPDADHSPPEHFVPYSQELGITAVVRLNEKDTYDAKVFEEAGIRHYDLYFDDCTTPSDEIITRFLDICDAEPCIAVHCLAGLGRTGTLIALYMMKNHGWTARECIGWLRVVRPGSVIGPQQHFLVAKCGRDWNGNTPPPTPEWERGVAPDVARKLSVDVANAVQMRKDN